jgi:membrane protein DedA with SNARE-associated domain
MMMLAVVSFLVGAVLGQRFKVLVLIPATAIMLVLAAATGVTQAQTAWSIVLMAAAAATSMQIGYLIGIAIHALAVLWSGKSSSLTSPTASTPAR